MVEEECSPKMSGGGSHLTDLPSSSSGTKRGQSDPEVRDRDQSTATMLAAGRGLGASRSAGSVLVVLQCWQLARWGWCQPLVVLQRTVGGGGGTGGRWRGQPLGTEILLATAPEEVNQRWRIKQCSHTHGTRSVTDDTFDTLNYSRVTVQIRTADSDC